jgi:hypothetical protein
MATTKKNKKIVTTRMKQLEEPLSPRGQMRQIIYRDQSLPEGASPAFDFHDSVDAVDFHVQEFLKHDAHLFTVEQRVAMEQVLTFMKGRHWVEPRQN